MSWWGKLVGGTFGFFLGGPLGAMFGMALGHNIDTAARAIGGKLSPGDQERVQMAFFTATFSVMGAVAKARWGACAKSAPGCHAGPAHLQEEGDRAAR